MSAISPSPKLNPPMSIEREPVTRERMEFERNMITQNYLNEQATREEAEHYFRRLIQSAAFLSRRHGFTVSEKLAKLWNLGLEAGE